jgi:competence protein ComEA
MRTSLRRIFANAQSFTSTTRSELLVVVVLLAGLIVGALGRRFVGTKPTVQSERSEILRVSDSLATAELTTFTGTTPDGEPVGSLALADTIVKNPSRYPSQSPKPQKMRVGTVEKIHLSTATLQDLMRLPGVGEATAQKILAQRSAKAFDRIEDVMRVKGIGTKKFEAMKPFLDL